MEPSKITSTFKGTNEAEPDFAYNFALAESASKFVQAMSDLGHLNDIVNILQNELKIKIKAGIIPTTKLKAFLSAVIHKSIE